ncbi:MAG TPA: hypothetical protein PLN21_05395 [Gemmatales bacterium]|nr:hypothetical protein [Gemmatales bacterium]
MLTTIGKNLVYVIVILSITGLGISLWAVADRTDFKALSEQLVAEDGQVRKAQAAERAQLELLLSTVAARSTKIPRGPDEIAANKDMTIAKALEAADDLENEIKKIAADLPVDIQARISLINDLQALREKLRVEKETGNALRLIMTPDDARIRQGQKSYRDTIAQLQVAKEEVEKRTEAMQPDMYNAAIRLQNLQQRFEGLKKRASELGIQ